MLKCIILVNSFNQASQNHFKTNRIILINFYTCIMASKYSFIKIFNVIIEVLNYKMLKPFKYLMSSKK